MAVAAGLIAIVAGLVGGGQGGDGPNTLTPVTGQPPHPLFPTPEGGLTREPGSFDPSPIALVISHGRTGKGLARLEAPAGTPLQLTYVHSIYRQPAIEEFRLDGSGLTLIRLGSPSAAVLEYYARPEPLRPIDGGFAILPAPIHYPTLTILASERGERTVVYGPSTIPLYRLVPDGDPVRLGVAAGMR